MKEKVNVKFLKKKQIKNLILHTHHRLTQNKAKHVQEHHSYAL